MIRISNVTAIEQAAKIAAKQHMLLPRAVQATLVLAGGLSGQGLWDRGLVFVDLSSCFEGGISLDSPSYGDRLDPTINRSGRRRRVVAMPS